MPRRYARKIFEGRGLYLLVMPNGSRYCATTIASAANTRRLHWEFIPMFASRRLECDTNLRVHFSRTASTRRLGSGRQESMPWLPGASGLRTNQGRMPDHDLATCAYLQRVSEGPLRAMAKGVPCIEPLPS